MPDPTLIPLTVLPPDTKPWWRSTTLQSLVVLLIMLALQKAKINIPGLDADVTNLVTNVFETIGAAGVVVGRAKAAKVITLTTVPALPAIPVPPTTPGN